METYHQINRLAVLAKRSRLTLGLCLVLLSLTSVSCGSSQPNAEDMRKLIAVQLPIGSTKSEVTAFLDSRSIRHEDIQEHFELDEEHRRINTRILTASIQHKSFGFETSRVLMVFYFDESDRLTKYEVKNVYTAV
jgi:hypothetical protein